MPNDPKQQFSAHVEPSRRTANRFVNVYEDRGDTTRLVGAWSVREAWELYEALGNALTDFPHPVERLARCMGMPGAGLSEVTAEIQKHAPWNGREHCDGTEMALAALKDEMAVYRDGEAAGTAGAVMRIREALDGDKPLDGVLGDPQLEELRRDVRRLKDKARAALDGWRIGENVVDPMHDLRDELVESDMRRQLFLGPPVPWANHDANAQPLAKVTKVERCGADLRVEAERVGPVPWPCGQPKGHAGPHSLEDAFTPAEARRRIREFERLPPHEQHRTMQDPEQRALFARFQQIAKRDEDGRGNA